MGPLSGYCLVAEYESGYIHSDLHQDISPYSKCEKIDGVTTGPNIFSDIVNKRPEPFHGKLVCLSLVPINGGTRYDIDWTGLPDNARPIRFVDREQDSVGGIVTEQRVTGLRFGYQYTDENGKNIKEIKEII